MRVTIDFRNTYNSDKALRMFTWEFWEDMALIKPNDEFIFLTGEEKAPGQPAENVNIRKLKKSRFKWLEENKLNKALHTWQSDFFITMHETGFTISSLQKKGKKKNIFAACKQIAFVTNAQVQPITENTRIPAILVSPACRTIVTSLSWTEEESIKTQYAGGRSFFLFIGNISEQHQLVELLKAFSAFKKWQQSNMQLVIAGYTSAWTAIFEEKLQTYKYKTDVVILKTLSTAEIAKLLAACYAVVYPVAKNIFPLALLWAIQSNKAIIVTDSNINRQIIQDAEWVDEKNTAEDFGKAMILLYKDEKHQQLRVQQTIEASEKFNRSRMLAEVWESIEK